MNHRCTPFHSVSNIAIGLGFVFASVCATPSIAETCPEGAAALQFEAGQRLSLLTFENLEGEEAEAIRAEYSERAFPLSSGYGRKREAVFPVTEVLSGETAPSLFVLASWPSAEAEKTFEQDPKWPDIRALRSKAWRDLIFYKSNLEADLDLCLRQDKFYTLGIAWSNPDHPDDYDRYLAASGAGVTEAGGEILFQWKDPDYETLSGARAAPYKVTLVEWNDADGYKRYTDSEAFNANIELFNSGVTYFEWFKLAVAQ